MTSRERIRKILNFQIPDRIGLDDSFWSETLSRWRSEGMPSNMPPHQYFGFDILKVNLDLSPRFTYKVLEEKEETRIIQDNYGSIGEHWKSRSGPPKIISVVVNSPSEWLELKAKMLFTAERIAGWNTVNEQNKNSGKEHFITVSTLDPYENTWRICDVPRLLEWMLTEPNTVRDMFMTAAELTIKGTQALMEKMDYIDGLWLWGDIAYRNGPLFSPKCYRELLKPAHQLICDFARQNNLPVIYHTDGDIRPLIDDLLEAGIRALQPLEAKAGLDVRKLKQQYADRLVLFGNIDIRAMSSGDRKIIEEEIKSKIPIAANGGGYIYHSDHSVPPSVSFQDYLFTLEMVKKYGRYEVEKP